MFRTLSEISATVLVFLVQPAFAQAPQARAVPTVAVASASNVIAGDNLWKCGSDGCMTAAITARPVVACAQVAKKVGTLSSFVVAGTALAADDLAKCNAKAKGAGATAVANAN